MVEFEYTPRVASETAGLGFSLPLPQRQVGVDVRNANPNTRASMMQDMPFYEVSEDIDPTLTNLRDAYIADVQGLNALVQEAVALGYDPRTIDYQDPQSVEINRMYREMLNPIKQKELQLRYAKPVTQRMRQAGEIYDPATMDVANLVGFGGAEDIAKAASQSISSYGYDEAGLKAAEELRANAIANIDAYYAPQMQKFAGNEAMLQSLETMRQRDLNSIKTALPRAKQKERDPIRDFEAREIVKANIELQKEQIKSQGKYEKTLKQMTPRAVSGNLIVKGTDGKKVRDIGQRVSAPLTKSMEPATVTAKYYSKSTPLEARNNLDKFRYDSMEIIGIDKDGNVIEGKDTPISQYDRFEVVMKGSAKVGGKRNVAVYDTFGNVVRGLSEEEEAAYEQVYNSLVQQANQMNANLRGGSTPSNPSSTAPALNTNTQATDVSSIFGKP